MKQSLCHFAAVTLVWLLSPTVQAQIDGLTPGCEACHGPNGISLMNDVPTIAGISELVLEDAIYAYREGDRSCKDSGGASLTMCAPAAALEEADITAVAEHYAGLPFAAADQEADAAKAAQGKAIHDRDCEICHSQGGTDPEDDASILGGQHMGYLRHALTEYQAGARPQPRPMEAKVSSLSAADIDALVHFYASQR
jgi:sulfide dehydrogenase cytochrome subunit